MRTALILVFTFVALTWLTTACGHHQESHENSLAIAEQAFADGRYAKAQQIADTIIIGNSFSRLSADGLCRLSLLFMRLGDASGNEDVNVAMAVRSLNAAMKRDSDSTRAFIRAVPYDDRGRVALIQAIANAYHGANIEGDTVYFDTDSIF